MARPQDMGIVASQVYPYGRQIVPYQWTNFDDLELRSKQPKRPCYCLSADLRLGPTLRRIFRWSAEHMSVLWWAGPAIDLRQPFSGPCRGGVVPEDNLKTADMDLGLAILNGHLIFIMVEVFECWPSVLSVRNAPCLNQATSGPPRAAK
jgi:hypothetical protein